jgi:hypothetical protein
MQQSMVLHAAQHDACCLRASHDAQFREVQAEVPHALDAAAPS